MSRTLRVITFLGIVLTYAAEAAQGQTTDFYKDKTIRFIVGYSAGGSFDLYTRVIARHFPKHVPGSPTTAVENMTGAGGIIAANHMYNRAAPDGLVIGGWASALVLQQIMGNEAVKFDARKFGYLGVPSASNIVCAFNDKSGIASMSDWINAKRPLKISAIGPGTSTSDVPKLIKAALNMPLEVVDGYKGGADARLAVESGEVDGYCGSWQTIETVWRNAYETGKIHAVLQTSLESHPRYQQVPLAINYAKTDLARQLITIADSAHGREYPYTVPPGITKDRLGILQRAFVNTVKDSEFLAEAKKSNLDVDMIDGSAIANRLNRLFDIPPDVLAKVKEVLLPKK
jgi:tripartite-type tricarboxylate transporter receptor subunit TctC